AIEFFVLALAHWQLGHQQQARKWYVQAVEWMEKNNPDREDLQHLRAEAAELLGIDERESSLKAQSKNDDAADKAPPLNPDT
ncbi:MAG TPA: hypothetical protein VGK58_11210, partial [Lacipirellulaceae bacterium]